MSNKDYFNFSFIEMGDHDLPAMIDYVLDVTGQKKVAYVAHSQGTSQMFYALTANEDYFAERVSVFAAVGPVTQMKHIKATAVKTFADSSLTRALLETTCETLGIYDFFQPGWFETGSMRILCDTLPSVCEFMIYMVSDNNTTLVDTERLQVYMGGHYPSGSSLKQFLHFAQLISSGRFQKYDYGATLNQKYYGQELAPEIDISTITRVPIGLFVGSQDELADAEDNVWAS